MSRADDAFEGRIALVTGGASGIGAALCRALAAAGARVVVADIDAQGARRMADALGSNVARALTLDVADRAAFQAAVDDVVANEGRLDYLFNNAGIAVIGNVLKMEPAHWDRLVDVNIRGVHHGVEAAYPQMVRQGSGHIVNTASIAGLIPTPGFTAYGMTKHAVVGLSVSLRAEARRYGVQVSAVCPGVIDSNMAETAQLLGHEQRMKDENPELSGQLRSPDYCAAKVLAGVRRNKAIIPVTMTAHIGWRLQRFLPALMRPVVRRMADLLAPRD